MCTVTLLPTKTNFILTSNRDEVVGRTTLPLAAYEINGTRLLFPKDELAGGTWIGLNDNQQMICLLNGGFTNHTKLNYYRHSRGVVVTDLLSENEALITKLENYNCEDLEPFTLVALDWTSNLQCYEFVWDGNQKRIRLLKNEQPHIWSSSTLYTNEMKERRKDWFADFLLNNKPDSTRILDFHKNGGIGNAFYDLQIKRGDLQTRSITQVYFKNETPVMRYEDLLENKVHTKSLEPVSV